MTAEHTGPRIEPHPKKAVQLGDKRMTYVELGGPLDGREGPAFVFLHGNPTSSYLWRNVVPALAALGRVIAPDLIGMGDSDKLADPGPDTYRFATHRDFLDRFIDTVIGAVIGTERPIVLVGHDWGSALAFDWANRHRNRVAGIAYMEAIVRPLDWAEWPEASRRVFQGFRSPAGEEMILDRNLFVERVLPASILRRLDPAEMDEYRRPFAGAREDRWPTLSWPRELPIDGEPADVVALAASYAEWMAENDVPKLFVNAEPGAILTGAAREFCRSWHNQTEVTVRGSHFIQEDSGPEIGRAIADWASGLTGRGGGCDDPWRGTRARAGTGARGHPACR
jgi:haloalkane dehalogenase